MKLDAPEARNLMRRCDFAALATQSARVPGYPFVSHAPFACDGEGRALLLLSRLAEHSRNLGSDPRASLMATLGASDPLGQPRVTLLGELRSITPSPPLQDRYVRYHPESGAFLGFGDFRFYRFEPLRVRMVGGFSRAGWIEAAQWRGRRFDERRELELLGALQTESAPPGWRLLGLDWEGLDARDRDGARRRLVWPQPAQDEAELAETARHALGGAT